MPGGGSLYIPTPGYWPADGKAWTTSPEREQRPSVRRPRSFPLEGVPLGLRRDRIGGAVHREENGRALMSPLLAVAASSGSVHGYEPRLNVAPVAREIRT
jgi:hypothetical protein